MIFDSYQFLCFFPLVTLAYFLLPRRVRWSKAVMVAGPIERSENLLRQMNHPSDWNIACARDGLMIVLLCFFEKKVVADRAGSTSMRCTISGTAYPAGRLCWRR